MADALLQRKIVAKICLCMSSKTLKRNLEILDKYRKYADMAELRVDCLDPDERLLIRRFPEQAGMPVILTIRRDIDGGRFIGGEGARISLMARGLAYAETDRRRNFAFLDIEEDLNVPSLEEAARTFGTRIIRSYHNIRETDADLSARIRSIRHSGDEIVKVSVTANSTRDVLKLLQAGKEFERQEKILIAMGHYGIYSRILAEQFGSFLSYVSAHSEADIPPAAPGQIEVKELAKLYRFRTITKNTKVYGVTGNPLKATGSPQFFNTIFSQEGINAVYVPFPADSITDFMEIARELNVEGISVTVPYKEAVLPFLDNQSDNVRIIGACNTLILTPQGWFGTNTDGNGFSDSLLSFAGIPNFKKQRITVIGAGGAARAVISELHRLGAAKVLIINRTAHKARNLAVPYKYIWGGMDDRSIDKIDKYRDIIIQTTPVGMEGTNSGDPSIPDDPLAMYNFSGQEVVMDLVYEPKMTAFLGRAANAGCNVQNGYDMLIRQAQYQYAQFTGKEIPDYFLSHMGFDGA
ncbi:MAG: type I 3-dehydroquinate dehydratase [Treponema sp.]|nr:type I 3-dehydroquinate dehydratase [Treponema sp.]